MNTSISLGLLSFFLCLLLVTPGVLAQNQLYTDLHRVDVLDLFISERYLTCSTELFVVAEIKNTGTEPEYVHVELSSPSLRVHAFSPITQLDPNTIDSITMPLTLEEEPEGLHEFEVLVYYHNEIKRSFKTFTFEGCAEVHDIETQSDILVQTGSTPSPRPSLSLSGQMLFVMIMVLVVFLLAVAYLLKLFFQKVTGGK
jgi:hypothetical protein